MVTKFIKRLFSAPVEEDQEDALQQLAPDKRFYVVGDVHGRFDLLQRLFAELDADCPIVCVGDYIDRGKNSAQVLRHLQSLSCDDTRRVICLSGNHEEMLLQFLDDPEGMARMWARNGGLETLASFGIETQFIPEGEAEKIAQDLRIEMGEPLLDWLTNLPLNWTSGNVTVVHAALDPASPVQDQTRQVCLWGHPRFPERPRKDGQWVVRGHTIVTEPTVSHGVISVDTGAFASGQLTAAEISRGQIRFLSTDRQGVTRL